MHRLRIGGRPRSRRQSHVAGKICQINPSYGNATPSKLGDHIIGSRILKRRNHENLTVGHKSVDLDLNSLMIGNGLAAAVVGIRGLARSLAPLVGLPMLPGVGYHSSIGVITDR
ncbi:hypothetical protein FDG2_0248 [Candidatus Protofrankia californiensis]|uniref:Uncharacterized protein n=1 Tax=Candidatus Protofrankia californiensis TaxID=1839754 RepID=A0A1C3NT51_9ACTN|nr:hypothetical protein FDG2_0248 [Candidatus Protofrankia californiensis]